MRGNLRTFCIRSARDLPGNPASNPERILYAY
jgi:hypothetical protein